MQRRRRRHLGLSLARQRFRLAGSLVVLKDGRLVMVYGYRLMPSGIRAKVSEDGGRTWGGELIVRDDGGAGRRLPQRLGDRRRQGRRDLLFQQQSRPHQRERRRPARRTQHLLDRLNGGGLLNGKPGCDDTNAIANPDMAFTRRSALIGGSALGLLLPAIARGQHSYAAPRQLAACRQPDRLSA